jgi:glycosyltransferase involved in cell wall biosynthesis
MTKKRFIEPRLVTVVVPTIGRSNYIIDTMLSVIEQDYKNIEILLSDNKTEVKTKDLFQSLNIHDSRIKFFSHENRLNFSEHMNFCINNASGYYLMILSDDDQITTDYVSEMVRLFESNHLIKVSLGRQLCINESNTGRMKNVSSKNSIEIFEGHDFLKQALKGNINELYAYISLFAKKNDILKVGGFKDYPYGAHSDNYLFFNLALEGKVALGKSYFFYRTYHTSTGLGMPFTSLLLATKKYQHDILRDINELYNLKKISSLNKKVLSKFIKSQNSNMILSRAIHIYRKRISFVKFLYYVILSGLFSVLNKF